MPSSFEKINYSLRPNKSIERKMISEALLRLSFIDHLKSYRYIGFGSPYFVDFCLFHKNLGINDLISIEKEISKKKRFEFNIPYSAIQMHYGDATSILPNLELGKTKDILWLDYDAKISDYMFQDIETFFFNAAPGSFFILSVNVEQDALELSSNDDSSRIELKKFRMNELVKRIGKSRLPSEFKDVNLTTKNLTAVTIEMINRKIVTSLKNRNGMDVGDVSYQQVFNFLYKDNATILTLGGIVFDKTQKSNVNKMAFDQLSYTSSDERHYRIKCPNLTIREIKALDNALPDSLEYIKEKFASKKLQKIPLSPTDIKNYAEVYRYYPNFAETNI